LIPSAYITYVFTEGSHFRPTLARAYDRGVQKIHRTRDGAREDESMLAKGN